MYNVQCTRDCVGIYRCNVYTQCVLGQCSCNSTALFVLSSRINVRPLTSLPHPYILLIADLCGLYIPLDTLPNTR